MRKVGCLIVLSLAGLAAPPAGAEVADAGAGGFHLHYQLALDGVPAARAYAALAEVARWWNPLHSYSGEAARLSLDPRAGGCFCEMLPDGGSVQHMTVVMALPKAGLLRLSGALGPLQAGGLSGSLTLAIKPAEAGSQLVADYLVGGYTRRPLPQWAPDVDAVLGEQLQRYRRYLIDGKPD